MAHEHHLREVLERLSSNIGQQIGGAVAVHLDGTILASQMGNDVNAERVAIVAATMIGVTRRASGELNIGMTEETIISSDNGMFMIVPAGDENILAVNLRAGANLGIVRIEARGAAEAISRFDLRP